jgi:hypothetical protein
MSELNETEENNQLIIVNKGAGAGCTNTNKNGLSYEEITDLKVEF